MISTLQKVTATLQRVPLFNGLSPDELAGLARIATCRDFQAGVIVFNEGSPCTTLHIVAFGAVRILKVSSSGREQFLRIEMMGGILDEVAALDGLDHSATATTEVATQLVSIPAAAFRQFCEQNPAVTASLMKVLGGRLRHLTRLVEELSFSTVRSRLIQHLILLAQEKGVPAATGVTFRLEERNQQLAARLGTVRELVSRNLGRLRAEGLIAMQGREVHVPNLAALSAELERS